MRKQPKSPNAHGWRSVYNEFIAKFEIDSKEFGRTALDLWGTQLFVLDEIAVGMDEGIRFFVVPKGRQYGVTTAIIPLDVLWMLMHPGIEGAFIGHKQDVIEVCRAQVNDIQIRLPESYKVKLKTNNKERLEWEFRDGTISTLNLLVAGTTERRTDLAKGHGLTLIHGSECGEWGSETAFNSLLASLAEQNPNRLYIFESTGEGANNLFARLTRKSLDHPARKVIFPPWWLQDLYRLDKRSKLYRHYMANPTLSDEEQEIVHAAKRRGYELGLDQIAWYRKKTDEQTTTQDMRKNYPTVIEDCFQLGGDAFIPAKPLRLAKESAEAKTFEAFQVSVGDNISTMKITSRGLCVDEEDGHARGCDLRVWDTPKPRGVYSIAVEPSESADKVASVQVLRCFSDSVEQVAEFAAYGIEPYHLAWVTAYLAGWYKNCWVNVDLGDGGRAVFREMQNLRNQVSLGAIGGGDIFGAMIFYLYNRIDNVSGASRTWNWEWNTNTTLEAFADFKGSFLTNRLLIHSVPLTEEMTTLVDEGNHIGGDDGADDSRCSAMCIAIRTWVDHVRLGMIGEKRTRESEMSRDAGSAPATFLENIVNSFVRRNERAVRDENNAGWRR